MVKPRSKKTKAAEITKAPKGFVKAAMKMSAPQDPGFDCVIEGPNGIRIELNKADLSYLLQLLAIPGGS